MSFLAGVELSVVAMLIVFALLYVIALILNSLKLIAGKEKAPEKKKNTQAPKQSVPVVQKKTIAFEELEKDPDMMAAALAATIDAAENSNGKNFRVVGIKQL